MAKEPNKRKAAFTVRPEDTARTGITVEADSVESAVEGAWRLQRHYEAPVIIVDNRTNSAIARLNLEWLDG